MEYMSERNNQHLFWIAHCAIYRKVVAFSLLDFRGPPNEFLKKGLAFVFLSNRLLIKWNKRNKCLKTYEAHFLINLQVLSRPNVKKTGNFVQARRECSLPYNSYFVVRLERSRYIKPHIWAKF